MANPLELSIAQSFEKERFTRAIENSQDIKEVKEIAKVLLGGWFTQKAATQWVLQESLKKPATINPEALGFAIPTDDQ
jgi:hypothetical protein